MTRATGAAEPAYVERLWPGPALWLLLMGLVGALGLAYGHVLGPRAGWAVAAAGALGTVAGIRATSPAVTVEEHVLRAGRAALPLQFVGRVLAIDAEQAAMARGPQGDPTAHLVLRPGVGPGAVLVEVTDPEDPHATWLLASRHPERMARAVQVARGRLSP